MTAITNTTATATTARVTTTPRYGLWVDGPSWRGEITGGVDHPDDLRDPGGHRGIAREIVIDTGTGWRSLTPQEWRDLGDLDR